MKKKKFIQELWKLQKSHRLKKNFVPQRNCWERMERVESFVSVRGQNIMKRFCERVYVRVL